MNLRGTELDPETTRARVGSDPSTPVKAAEKPPCLCVDLDGTLVRGDTLIESLVILLRSEPWRAFLVLLWVFRGKARFKHELGRLVRIQPESLPYEPAVLDYLRAESAAGRKMLLVTGANSAIAHPVAEYLGFFSDVICSNETESITGKRKLAAIRRVLGSDDFSYAGNSRTDLPVWKGAKSAVIAAATPQLLRAVRRSGVPIENTFSAPKPSILTVLKAMRIYQWTKNALVLLPLLLSHRLFDFSSLANCVRGFFAFSLCASAVYLANDILDLPHDRKHNRKKHRPLPSGHLSVPAAVILIVLLLAGSVALNPGLAAAGFLAFYVASTMAYSLYLKRLLIVDVIMLASFYTIRLLYGGAAAGVTVSVWTLAFTMFLFLSLALIKRISELQSGASEEGLSNSGRGYFHSDVYQMSALCAASGCVSALVIILYVNSPEVVGLYSRPQVLLGVFPLLIYWQSRLLVLANRGAIPDDPIVFSLKDRASRAVAMVLLLLVIAAV
jgi:4-hydroxybenzoate polyprenyltransferase/phosphoserine phosphatase